MISKLSALHTVRRIVRTNDGQVIPLVDGVDKSDLAVMAMVLQTNGHPPTCAAFNDVARASDMQTIWDRVAEQLRPMTQIDGVEGIYHGWSDEKTEVPVGFETRNDVFGDSRVESGMVKYEERYLYPEGVYFIVLSSQNTDTVEQSSGLLERIDPEGKIDLMYVTPDELPKDAVQLV